MAMAWNNSELKQLEVDLSETPRRAQRQTAQRLAGPVGRKLAGAMRQDARGHQGNWFGKPGTEYNTPLERHVSHEMVGTYEVEAGIENKGAGKLGHIIAYGSVNNAPAYDPMTGPRRILPALVDDLADMARDAMLGDQK